MNIPPVETATWADVCEAFAEQYDESALIYRALIDDPTNPVHAGHDWPKRKKAMEAHLRTAINLAAAWRERKTERKEIPEWYR